jgi:TIR domain/NACHT domain
MSDDFGEDRPAIFISHTTHDRRDATLAHRLAAELSRRGARAWIAPDNIPGGAEWETEIVSGIMERCTHFLVILSEAAIRAPWVLKEVQLARARRARTTAFTVLTLVFGRVEDVLGQIEDGEVRGFIARFQPLPYHDDFEAQLECVAEALHLPPTRPSPIDRYLAAVRHYCANFPYLTLHDVRVSRSVGEMYVPLRARPQSERADKGELPSKAQGTVNGADETTSQGNSRSAPGPNTAVTITDLMRDRTRPHIVILGDAGTGKSTLLRRLADQCWDAPHMIGLDAPCLPLLVPLRVLAAKDGSLEDRISKALSAELALVQGLPQGFFEGWSKQKQAQWLILLDALDEVPSDEYIQLTQWINATAGLLSEHRIVIASRATGYQPGTFDDRLFAHCELQPFTPGQIEEFARNWFVEDARNFLGELERICAGELRGTALLLTIAAAVYQRTRPLPERRASLYRRFVDIWLSEAVSRGLNAELGEKLAGPSELHLARLAFLALRMTEQPKERSRQQLSSFVAEYLRVEEKLPKSHAEVYGKELIAVMARRSGVFFQRGDNYQMVHATFQEYLAAWSIASSLKPTDQSAWAYVTRWQEDAWQDVVLFLLSIWSELDDGVTALVERIATESDDGALFAGMVLAEGVQVSPDVEQNIVKALLVQLRRNWGSWLVPLQPLDVLVRLGHRGLVLEGLRKLAQDAEVDEQVRFQIVAELRKVGGVDVAETNRMLAAFVDEKPPGYWESDRSGYSLRRCADAGLLLALVENSSIRADLRLYAALKLVNWGISTPQDIAPILLTLSSLTTLPPAMRLEALRVLGKHGPSDEIVRGLRLVACDPNARPLTQILAVRQLIESGAQDEGERLLLAMLHDKFRPPDVRNQAGTDLFQFILLEADNAERLLTFACDSDLDPVLSHTAKMRGLDLLKEQGKDLDDLLATARDPQAQPEVRATTALHLRLWRGDARAEEVEFRFCARQEHLADLGGESSAIFTSPRTRGYHSRRFDRNSRDRRSCRIGDCSSQACEGSLRQRRTDTQRAPRAYNPEQPQFEHFVAPRAGLIGKYIITRVSLDA